jgi:predicted kinase
METIKIKNAIKMSGDNPYVLILIGPPLSGKDTLIRELNLDATVISRDQILLDLWDGEDYNEAFKGINQREVDRILKEKIETSSDNRENVIINMTNMTRKRRMGTLSNFDGYYKIAAVLSPLDKREYSLRNEKRKNEENKWIPEGVLESMIKSYQRPEKDEGFDKIIIL